MSQQPQDQNLLVYRVGVLETSVSALNKQLETYARERETDLKLSILQKTASQLETDIADLRSLARQQETELKELKEDVQKRDSAQQSRQDKMQISVLAWAFVTLVGFGLGCLGLFFSHIIP